MQDSIIILMLLSFSSGINFLVLFLSSIMLIIRGKYRFQKLFSITYFLWGLCFASIFFYDYGEFYFQFCFQNTLILILNFSIIGFMIISLLDLLLYKKPFSYLRVLFILPFILFPISYIITKNEVIYTVLQYFTMVLCLAIYLYIEIKVRIYYREIHDYYSNIERIHLKWTVYILRLCLVILVLWLGLSFNFLPFMDIIYNVLTLPLILYISYKIYFQELPEEINQEKEGGFNDRKTLIQGIDITALILEKKYYLTENLNLTMLASLIGTNRTYLSRFINKELNTNFYDYINAFRVEHAMRLLKDSNSKQSLEEVAYQSGFGSYTTFNRFFKKRYNTTPGGFRARKTSSNDLN